MNRCPNYLVCEGVDNKHSGVCFECDKSLYGYFHKKQDIMYGVRPTIDQDPGRDYHHYHNRKLEKEEKDNLYMLLKTRQLETGILDISEKIGECPVCLMEKNIFVKHPTCGIHEICRECFKITFLNEHIIYAEPEEPEGYDIFWEWADENEMDFTLSDPDDIEHPPDGFSYWVNEPKPGWPEHIKQIYPGIAKYYQIDNMNMEEYERRIDQAENLRACPVCREVNLKL